MAASARAIAEHPDGTKPTGCSAIARAEATILLDRDPTGVTYCLAHPDLLVLAMVTGPIPVDGADRVGADASDALVALVLDAAGIPATPAAAEA
jgi:hypothetical protein